ncbi:MAG: hypothetical protein GY804_10065 [Alphaproteobacteria bacterium]|nr:hypothetical protein [Alphaproteobacteria bacterium]
MRVNKINLCGDKVFGAATDKKTGEKHLLIFERKKPFILYSDPEKADLGKIILDITFKDNRSLINLKKTLDEFDI